jgi:hypothetical protein
MILKLIALLSLAILSSNPPVRFESDGIRIGDALLRGQVLELKSVGSAALLASGSSIEALTETLPVEAAAGRQLLLEPGLRVTRVEEGFRIASHGNRGIKVTAGAEIVMAASPVRVTPTPEGWIIGDRKVEVPALRAGLQAQDDVDSNLDKMKNPSEKLRAGAVPALSTRMVRVFTVGSPLTGSQAADSNSVRTISRVSPSGAP